MFFQGGVVGCASLTTFKANEAGGTQMMLKGIPAFMDAELLWILASMGHGDEIAVVDRNFSAARVARQTTTGKLVTLHGIDAPTAIRGILQLMPLDAFVERPVSYMEDGDQPGQVLAVHADVLEVSSKMEGLPIAGQPIERFAFYPIAMASFAVIQTSEARPYANFILKKGVL
jgi:L-fucose mutarotase